MPTQADPVENLILDLLEWLAVRDRTYEEVMAAWRTSCPRLPVWEEANDRGLLTTAEAQRDGASSNSHRRAKPSSTGAGQKKPPRRPTTDAEAAALAAPLRSVASSRRRKRSNKSRSRQQTRHARSKLIQLLIQNPRGRVQFLIPISRHQRRRLMISQPRLPIRSLIDVNAHRNISPRQCHASTSSEQSADCQACKGQRAAAPPRISSSRPHDRPSGNSHEPAVTLAGLHESFEILTALRSP